MATVRRDVLLLVLTHALAFTVPVLPLLPMIRNVAATTPWLNEWPAEEYSYRVAGFDVRVGDAPAAVAGLQRHVDRLTAMRNQLAAGGARAADLNMIDGSACGALAEIAVLSDAADRGGRIAEAAACYRKVCARCRAMDDESVLGLGARWVGDERSSE